jgi:hypothetical protein
MVRDRPLKLGKLKPGKPVLRARIHVGQQTCVAATTLRESPAPNFKSELTSGNPNAYLFSEQASALLRTPSAGTKSSDLPRTSPAGRPWRCTGLNNPQGVAADTSANDYIADTGNNRVLLETLSAETYSQTTVGSDLLSPGAVAVDGSGNIHIADTGNSRVPPRSTPKTPPII